MGMTRSMTMPPGIIKINAVHVSTAWIIVGKLLSFLGLPTSADPVELVSCMDKMLLLLSPPVA
jgi:hypothetical protein